MDKQAQQFFSLKYQLSDVNKYFSKLHNYQYFRKFQFFLDVKLLLMLLHLMVFDQQIKSSSFALKRIFPLEGGTTRMSNSFSGYKVLMENRSSSWKGYVFVGLAALCWASSGTAAKFLFQSGVTSLELVQLRITLASTILLAWLGGRQPKRLKIARQDILYFFILGGGAMASVQFTYLFAISKIHVAAAILLQYLAPIFIVLHAVIFAREALHRSTLLAMIGTLLGCYLVVGGYNLDLLRMNRLGILIGMLAGVSFAWYSLQGEYGMRRYHPRTVHFYSLAFAAVTWNILQMPLAAFFHPYSLATWCWILYVAIVGTLFPFGLYFEGVNLIRSTRASIAATLEPIGAGILAYLFLHEYMTWLQILGGILVIAAVIYLQLTQEHDEQAPNLLREKANAKNQS